MDASVTQLLKAWVQGDQQAPGELTPKVYLEQSRQTGRHNHSLRLRLRPRHPQHSGGRWRNKPTASRKTSISLLAG
jgi:hypothetical protein